MGKGSKRRPAQVPDEELAERWERTFGQEPGDRMQHFYAPEDLQEARDVWEDYMEGVSVTALAAKYNLTRSHVSSLLDGMRDLHDPQATMIVFPPRHFHGKGKR